MAATENKAVDSSLKVNASEQVLAHIGEWSCFH